VRKRRSVKEGSNASTPTQVWSVGIYVVNLDGMRLRTFVPAVTADR
jgi:hypothetical protein